MIEMIKLFHLGQMGLGLRILILLLVTLFSQNIAQAHVEQSKDLVRIGINEKLGQVIPLDLTFHDENGNPVSLKQLSIRPPFSPLSISIAPMSAVFCCKTSPTP